MTHKEKAEHHADMISKRESLARFCSVDITISHLRIILIRRHWREHLKRSKG